MLATDAPFPYYSDIDGCPLDVGMLYFGVANQNPETSPITVYWDAAGTQPAAQPILTLNGYTVRAGTPAQVFVGSIYSITVKNRRGRVVYYAPDSSKFSNDQGLQDLINGVRADLLSTSLGKGTQMVMHKHSYAAAVSQPLNVVLGNTISVADFMDPQKVIDGRAGIVLPDITVEWQAALNAFPRQGTPNWQAWKLVMPIGVFKTSGTVFARNIQGGEMHMGGCTIRSNFDGPILQIGDPSGTVNDVLRSHVYGGILEQQAITSNARPIKADHLYSCSLNSIYCGGGSICMELDGNANKIDSCAFRGSYGPGVKTGAKANNEANLFLNCSSELNNGDGYDLTVTSGVGGFTQIIGGYCEANGNSEIRGANSSKVIVEGVYFNLQDGGPGILLEGTVGPNYADPFFRVSDCRVEGPASGTPPSFIKEASSMSINAHYEGNTVRNGVCDLYGAAPKSINLRRRRDRVYVQNADLFSGGPPPTGWTLAGAGPVTTTASISPYGSGAAVQITGASYIHQTIKAPTNALLRVSCWASTTGADATLQLWNTAISGQYATISATSGTASRLELYLSPAMRGGAADFKILLRNVAGTNNAYFSDIVVEDMTN